MLFRLILALFPLTIFAQTDPVVYSVYCIGNTGWDTIPSAAIQLMAFESFDDSLSTIVVLGNVSGDDLKRKKFVNREVLMRTQYELFTAYQGKLFIVPGEAEWNAAGFRGANTNQQCRAYSENWFKQNGILRNKGVSCYPESPGPLLVQPRDGISLILMDSQWWLQRGILSANRKIQRNFLHELEQLCQEASKRGDLIFLAAHHPVISNGKRIHHKQPLRFLLNFSPLKLLSLAGIDRNLKQDMNQPRYRRYRHAIRRILQAYPGTILMAAHDYNMQYLVENQTHHILSGSGAITRQIDRYRFPARFMDDLQPGFFRITIHRSGKVYLHAYGANDRGEYWKSLMFTHLKTFE